MTKPFGKTATSWHKQFDKKNSWWNSQFTKQLFKSLPGLESEQRTQDLLQCYIFSPYYWATEAAPEIIVDKTT